MKICSGLKLRVLSAYRFEHDLPIYIESYYTFHPSIRSTTPRTPFSIRRSDLNETNALNGLNESRQDLNHTINDFFSTQTTSFTQLKQSTQLRQLNESTPIIQEARRPKNKNIDMKLFTQLKGFLLRSFL